MSEKRIVYLSGKITDKESCNEAFNNAEEFLAAKGYSVINTMRLQKSYDDLPYSKFVKLCHTLIDVCDIMFMVSGWNTSQGAKAELAYAKFLKKEIMYQDYYAPFRKADKNVQ